ncbi:glutathione peroxidase [Thalassotalea sp. 1_MG-2023]|uniref:glutathione peroxidase n=1 Tax=Thalassotalea sp. 1_MG-2023 TaxID=3062680 RepID=UPI0026E31274|nr:glutathione peroxidase [Thalassotalea sp. 1_MG-2023]MDO6428730.1 glutathione peroxidase [Thalassotalea sp. 1_MG-2023]
MSNNFYQYQVVTNRKQAFELNTLKNKVVLIVNTASACGFTPQYAGLEELYQKYKDKGFEILAFPCNQFGKQEKGDNEAIQQFCDLNFKINFPLMDKVEVNGDNAAPLFTFLKKEAPGIFGSKSIKWNFTKFLVDGNGNVVKRYSPTTKPEELVNDIERLLTV